MKQKTQFLLIGDKNEERFASYTRFLEDMNIKYISIEYPEFIKENQVMPEIEGGICVRIFSPWYTNDITDYFHKIGKEKDGFNYNIKKGDAFYTNTPKTTNGFFKFLQSLDSIIKTNVEKPLFVNPPLEIYLGRNKAIMAEHFEKHELNHPKTYFEIKTPQEIFELQKKQDNIGLFVKLCSGSVGRGIAVIEGDKVYTTIRKEKEIFYHDKQVRLLRNDSEIEEILQFLIDMDSIVQETVNLDKLNGKNYFIRHYIVHGQIPLSDLTISPEKINNSCLGAQQIANEGIKKHLSETKIKLSEKFAKEIYDSFESHDLGLDIGFCADSDEMCCFEANFVSGLGPEEKYIYEFEIQENLKKLKNNE